MIGRVAVCYGAAPTVESFALDGSGTSWVSEWSATTGAWSNGCAFGPDGSLYVASDTWTTSPVCALSPSGAVVWAVAQAYERQSIATDGVRVFDSGEAGAGTTGRAASTGEAEWSLGVCSSSSSSRVALGEDGAVYVGVPLNTGCSVSKSGADGTPDWQRNYLAVAALAADADGAVFCIQNNSGVLRCFDASGTEAWQHYTGSNTSGRLFGVAVSSDNDLVVVVGNVYLAATTRAFRRDGTALWQANHGAQVRHVAISEDGEVWTAGQASGGVHVRRYSQAGVELASFTAAATPSGLAIWSARQLETLAPGQSLRLSLAVPGVSSGVRTHVGPIAVRVWAAQPGSILSGQLPVFGIGFRLSLKPPRLTGIQESQPILDLRAPVYYRLFVAGEPMLELPLSSLQCVRRRGESTWLTVTVPAWSAALEADLVARGPVMILVQATGAGSAGDLLRATLISVDPARYPSAGQIVLTGRVVTPGYRLGSRNLPAVTELGRLEAGKRYALCALVDPALRPGEAVFDGVEAWLCRVISYRITPGASSMRVEE